MKILILCKRRPMAKDIFNTPFGRFYHLAYHLAELGHAVELVLFSYRRERNEQRVIDGLRMRSLSLWPNPQRALSHLMKVFEEAEPDWVVGFSDIYFGVLADYLARKYRKRSLIDAYDNYEAYMPCAIPVHWAWRRALANADLVTCAGPGLAELLGQYHMHKPVEIISMTTDSTLQTGLDRNQCRQRLGLPQEKKLIGYHGSIFQSRDVETLFKAAEILNRKNVSAQLVLAGRKQKNINIPDNVNYMGYLDDDDMASFIQSLNVLAVINKDSAFGQHSYPVKLYEAMACQIPVVASRTMATSWILREHSAALVDPENPELLAEALEQMLEHDTVSYAQLPRWAELAGQLEKFMQQRS